MFLVTTQTTFFTYEHIERKKNIMTCLFLTNTPTENEEIIDTDPSNQPKTVTPSTTKKGPDHTPCNISFAFDLSLTKPSTVSKETADAALKNNPEEEKW